MEYSFKFYLKIKKIRWSIIKRKFRLHQERNIKDLVEELVGEIEDEHDETSEIKIEKINFNTIIVEARATLDFLKDKLSLDLSKFKNEEFETLGGYIISLSGRVPIKGEVIRDVKNKIEFEIINSDKRKIIKVKIKGLKLLNES